MQFCIFETNNCDVQSLTLVKNLKEEEMVKICQACFVVTTVKLYN